MSAFLAPNIQVHPLYFSTSVKWLLRPKTVKGDATFELSTWMYIVWPILWLTVVIWHLILAPICVYFGMRPYTVLDR